MKTAIGTGIGTPFQRKKGLGLVVDLPLKDSIEAIKGDITPSFSRTTTATYTDGNGIVRYASINEPRFEGGGFEIVPGYDGIVSGGVTIEDGAMVFNGNIGTIIDTGITDNTIFTDGFAVSFKFNPNNSAPNVANYLVSKVESNSLVGFYLFIGGGESFANRLNFRIYDGSIWRTIYSGTILQSTEQHVILNVESDGTATFYINNVVSGAPGISRALSNITTTNPFLITNRDDGARPFDGSIKDVRIWNKSLSESERTQDFNGIKVTDGLVAEYTGQHYEGLPTSPIRITDTAQADFDVTFEGDGYLSEIQRVNLIPQSEDFSTGWDNVRSSENVNSVKSPDGTKNATTLIDNNENGSHYIRYQSIPVVNGGIYTFSVYVKPGTLSRVDIREQNTQKRVFFNMNTKTFSDANGPISYDYKEYDDGWFRIWMTFSTESELATAYIGLVNDSGDVSYTGDGEGTIYIWGAQLEAGSFVTSYIPTTSSAVTRTVDKLSYNVSSIITQGQGSLYCEFDCFGIDYGYFPWAILLSDGTSANYVGIQLNHTLNIIRAVVRTGSVFQQIISSSAITFNTRYKVLLSYEDNNISFYINGELIGTSNIGTIATNLTTLSIGNHYGSIQLNGRVKSAKYYKKPLSLSQAKRLTQ